MGERKIDSVVVTEVSGNCSCYRDRGYQFKRTQVGIVALGSSGPVTVGGPKPSLPMILRVHSRGGGDVVLVSDLDVARVAVLCTHSWSCLSLVRRDFILDRVRLGPVVVHASKQGILFVL